MILIIFTFQTVSLATDFRPDKYKPSIGNDTEVARMGGIIVGAVSVVGSIVSVLALVIIGVRFMLGSAEEKAEYKESMKPYLIGAILLFGVVKIVDFLYNFGLDLN